MIPINVWSRSCTIRRSSNFAFPNDFIQFEDLPPPTEEASQQTDDEQHIRFYVPPPLTDLQLEKLDASKIAEWPKSRVVWALGRLGFAQGRLASREVTEELLHRAVSLIPTMTSRDMIRVVQAVAYGPLILDPMPLISIRRALCTNIDSVNELYLLSLIYGHLKLVGRVDWKPSSNCDKMTQFLLSELIHRKGKYDATRFIEISSVICSSWRVVKSHSDSVQMIIRHACDVLKHSRDAEGISGFGRALCGMGPCETFFTVINDTLQNKFRNKQWKSSNDAVNIGFYFYLANLISVGTLSDWIKAAALASSQTSGSAEMLSLVKIIAQKRDQLSLLPDEVVKYLDSASPIFPQLTAESVHVYAVLRRMSDACISDKTFFGSAKVGPFLLPVCNESAKVFVQWEDGHQLETPHRRGVIRIINETRQWFLEQQLGWTVVSLKRSDFKPSTDYDLLQINAKFKKIISQSVPDLQVPWKHGDLTPDPMRTRLGDEGGSTSCSTVGKRERWESRSREFNMKCHLKLMHKRFNNRKKHSKK